MKRDTYRFPEDADEHSWYAPFSLEIDDEGSVFLMSEEAILMLSLIQARALHQHLGQAIIKFDRHFGYVSEKPVREVKNTDD